MKKNMIILCGISFAILISGCASGRVAVHQNWLSQTSPRIAVLPFNGDIGFAEELSQSLVTEMVNKGMTVIERSEIPQIFQEQSLQQTGAIDPATLVNNGKLAGVDFIVMGTVSTRLSVPPFDWFFGDGKDRIQIDNVYVRWVSVQSGQIMASASLRNNSGGSVEDVSKRITKMFDQKVQSIAQAPRNELKAQTRLTSVATYAYGK